jgi:hypothetical protein
MKLNTALAVAVAAAFAVPLAAQASADADKIIVAQHTAPGQTTAPSTDKSSASTEKADRGATATGGFAGVDKNRDGYISRDEARDASWENRFTELDKDNDNRLSQSEFNAMQAGAGGTGKANAPVTGGSNSADRKPNTPKQ